MSARRTARGLVALWILSAVVAVGLFLDGVAQARKGSR